MAYACFGMDSLNDLTKVQERYNLLDTKFKEMERENAKAWLDNCRENIIPKKDKAIVS